MKKILNFISKKPRAEGFKKFDLSQVDTNYAVSSAYQKDYDNTHITQ